jgi:hypothetical protein
MKTVNFVFIFRGSKKDEFLEMNYARAWQAAEIVGRLGEWRKVMEEQVESASVWRNVSRVLWQVVEWLEMWLDAPFESKKISHILDWLLNVIEYVELMEQSSLESELDDTIQLFTTYMKVPIKEIKVRIIKKMVLLSINGLDN